MLNKYLLFISSNLLKLLFINKNKNKNFLTKISTRIKHKGKNI